MKLNYKFPNLRSFFSKIDWNDIGGAILYGSLVFLLVFLLIFMYKPTDNQRATAKSRQQPIEKFMTEACALKNVCETHRKIAVDCIPSIDLENCLNYFSNMSNICEISGEPKLTEYIKIRPSTVQCFMYLDSNQFIGKHISPRLYKSDEDVKAMALRFNLMSKLQRSRQ